MQVNSKAYLKQIFSMEKPWFSTAKPKHWLSDTCSPEVKASLSTFSKVQTIVRQLSEPWCKETASIEAWPSTGRSLQDISDMPLWLLQCSLNIHLEVLLIRQTRCNAAGGGAGLKESDRKCSLRLDFLLGAGKTLLSYYNKKNDVKWSDNALTKPVIQACPLWTEKYRCTINWDNTH